MNKLKQSQNSNCLLYYASFRAGGFNVFVFHFPFFDTIDMTLVFSAVEVFSKSLIEAF